MLNGLDYNSKMYLLLLKKGYTVSPSTMHACFSFYIIKLKMRRKGTKEKP